MKRIILGVGILVAGLLILNLNLPIKESDVVGTYVNTNYENKSCCVEAPHIADTLTIKADKTFSSGFYGNGTYVLSRGTDINWTYKYEMGTAKYQTYLTNRIFEKQRIILNSDLNHYYEKIK